MAYGLTKHLTIIYVCNAYISEFICLHYVDTQYLYIISYRNLFGGFPCIFTKKTSAITTVGGGYSLIDSMSKTHFRCDANFIEENPFGFPHFSSRCLIHSNILKRKWNILFFSQLSYFQKSTTCWYICFALVA